ncbi:TPA: hypothetical protein NI674_006233 [Pseudomonas aeruginosa]|uniref:hypothetical protein n=1 Tax=Pseudomonas aeruginosa group TaxID=136841 RepID=UPI0012D93713|nr:MULTISPECIES: hypothetical protein [Pseudomonas aeruginosa group]MBH9459191.1 hypothetical protein [Pseudomonas aeruginosa]MBH9465968.1 hypothetical protein [Pseudomonas aeruginosa]MUI47053.1 hypothetical protein [Pseudomonas aeruginosa]QPZ62088.1 hypothetical protein I9X26_12070 [Pseudomonas aeruginosa]HCF0987686.1 hypothetical protein [Pseudomonas aeruginosa]
MPASSSPHPLFRIDECSDLMADVCVCSEQGDLIFLSVWARDTAVQQFLARLTLGRDQDGLDQFHLITEQGGSVPVFVPSVERLEKRLTRSYRRTLFGSLVNLWLFDSRCTRPDKSTASALALLPRSVADPTSRLWQLVKDTCPLPLLDHWQSPVLGLLREHQMLQDLPVALGPLRGFRLGLDVPVLTDALSALIRQGALTAHPSPLPAPADAELEAVA